MSGLFLRASHLCVSPLGFLFAICAVVQRMANSGDLQPVDRKFVRKIFLKRLGNFFDRNFGDFSRNLIRLAM